MLTTEERQLITKTKESMTHSKALVPRKIGQVGSTLVTTSGKTHFGVSIDCDCGIGFCAEHGAVASMVATGETKIRTIVAMSQPGDILPPCGRCRELIYQIDPDNDETDVIVGADRKRKLKELLPDKWQEHFYKA
ncbi:MAG: cytidine deaminase [Nanoarchaeota archaeon]